MCAQLSERTTPSMPSSLIGFGMAASDRLDHLVRGPGDRRLSTAKEDDPRRHAAPGLRGGSALSIIPREDEDIL
jgi:hypothetical protein